MQIAYDLAERQDPRDIELWRDYCEAMFGAKVLTWSRGGRARVLERVERALRTERAPPC